MAALPLLPPEGGPWGNWKLECQQFAQRGPLGAPPAGPAVNSSMRCCGRGRPWPTVARASRGGGRSHPLALLLRGELHKLDKPPGSQAALLHRLAGQRGRAARAGAGGGSQDGLALPRGFPHRCHLGDGLGVRRNAPAPASGHECILRAPPPRQ